MSPEAPLILDVRAVRKTFGEGEATVEALKGVDLQVHGGEMVLVMGPSGSGKTTLLSIVGALLRPSSGTVRIAGHDVTGLPERRLPAIRIETIGFVFQDFNLLSALTARENVEVVLNFAGRRGPDARRRAESLLSDLGLSQRLDFLPEKLSGGERQRVAIARALANDPQLLLCDEPTANLDSKIGHEVVVHLQQIAHERGKSVVIVSHDERIRQHADRTLWLEDGLFEAMAGMATDPVCGMVVRKDQAVTLEQDGETIYFCSRGCSWEWQETHSADRAAREAAEGRGPGL